MDSSRRSTIADRAILKKPRLAADSNGGPPSDVAGDRPTRPADPRIRAVGERDRAAESRDRDRGRESRYQPQPLPQLQEQKQQFQELLAQYRVALADLTFNSKPIITNLTIIAGENLHAAKAIANTICSHIIEVPSDQKLPSLYLLDSIVKNIARDYIKCFSARLPEVFCKAYKQVDSSVHPGMRHLFGTWKGVFPPGPLHVIEKELGLTTIANSSSGSTAAKPEPQAPRATHSIHVNPKYVEARQRIEQSTRVKEENSNDTSTTRGGANVRRSDRSASVGNAKPWTDLHSKAPNNQLQDRAALGETVNRKNEHKKSEFLATLSRKPEQGSARVGVNRDQERVLKQQYSAGSSPAEQLGNSRNDLDANHVYTKYGESGPAQAGRHITPIHVNSASSRSELTFKSWKNSEEEEFMWDDMGSRLADNGVPSSSTQSGWKPDNVDKSTTGHIRGTKEMKLREFRSNRTGAISDLKYPRREEQLPLFKQVDKFPVLHAQEDADSRTRKDISAELMSAQQAESSHMIPLGRPCDQPPETSNHSDALLPAQSEGHIGRLSSGINSSISNSGLLSHSNISTRRPLRSLPTVSRESRGTDGQQLQPLRTPSPSAPLHPSSTPLLHPKSHILSDLDNHCHPLTDQKSAHPSVQFNRTPISSNGKDLLTRYARTQGQQFLNPLKLQPPESVPYPSASSPPFGQLSHQLPYLQQSQSDVSVEVQLPQHQPFSQADEMSRADQSQAGEISGADQMANAAVDVSSQSSVGNLAAAIMKTGLFSSNLSKPTSNIQPPLPSGPPPHHALALSSPVPTSVSLSFHKSRSSSGSPNKAVLPPLPPGPPPTSSLLGSNLQDAGASGSAADPFPNLLRSLLAKGLISSSTKLPPPFSASIPAEPSDQSAELNHNVKVSSASHTASISPPQTTGAVRIPDSSTAASSAVIVDLIGTHFAPEILREFHPVVVNSLCGDLKHQCAVCGLRFMVMEELQRHLNWHESEKHDESKSSKLSRSWFVDAERWLARSLGATHRPTSATSVVEEAQTGEDCEPMVPADERQCICALCGEPFEDFYSSERDEWMYKGTVYFESLDNRERTIESEDQVPIVHVKCMSRNSGAMEVDRNTWLA